MRLPALVMAGGKGERFGRGEKPLARYMGRPLVEHVLRALERAEGIGEIHVVTSPWTSETERHLKEKDRWNVLRAPGRGYVEDLVYALETLNLGPTLTAASDLPLIRPEDIDLVVREYLTHGKPSLAVMVPIRVFRGSGLTPTLTFGDLVPAGINVVDGRNLDGPQKTIVIPNHRYAVNVNTRDDLLRLNRKAFK
jgi:adenosylcobinamide-phosphate guanylyltransferase